MHSFEIRRIRLKIENDYAWVSLWFRASPRKLEVLHFVCQKCDERPAHERPARRSKFDSVYLERYDQAIACYGAAKRILVDDDCIKVDLNSKGVKALCLDRAIELVAPKGLAGWKKAHRVFRVMAGYWAGHAIEIA
jgi:hypothetical protein